RQGKIVAVLQWRNLGEEAEILAIAVDLNYRRQGNASFLLTNFVQHLRQSAVRKILLEVRESNVAALTLDRKFGFQISGSRTSYYRNPEESALLMNLSLQA